MDLIDRVRQLIDAENQADPQKAGELLARDFVAITRGDGEEEDRSALLKRIGSPPNRNAFRELDEFGDWKSGELGVVRSLVRTKDSATQAVSGEFRNLHVFKKEAGTWVCVDWQVTK